MGRSDLFLQLEILKKTNTTIAILVGLQFGIWGLLIAQVCTSYIALFIHTYYTAKLIGYSIKEQVTDVLQGAKLAISMLLCASTHQALIPAASSWLLLLSC